MFANVFGWTRYPTDPTPGQVWLWWTTGASLGAMLVRPRMDALSRAHAADEALSVAGPVNDALSRARITSDLLES